MKVSYPETSRGIAVLLVRVSFGLSLLLVGIVHYMTFEAFRGMAAEGLGALEGLGSIWAYVLPALMIVGGALFVIGKYMNVATWAAGLALASIPAGMLLKPVLSGISLADVMGPAINAFVWLVVFLLVVHCEMKEG